MGDLALPKAYSVAVGNKNLCARIGIRIDGVDQERTIAAYDVAGGWARKLDGTVVKGTIEPYWR
jgi:hypothetical protein